MSKNKNIFVRLFRFYYDGFRGMTWGRQLWLIIFIKLFIMFAIFRVFFFPNILNSKYDSDEEKSNHVLEELTKRQLNTNTND